MKHRKVQSGGATTDLWDMKNVTNLWSVYMKPLAQEQVRLLPDSLILGSALLALLTQSFSMTIFFVSMLETAGFNYGLQSLASYLEPTRLVPTVASASPPCRSGFVTNRLDTFSLLKGCDITSSFPSPILFFVSTAASYMLSSMYGLREELENLGPEYSARFYIAIATSFFLLLALASYRLYYKCDGMGVATMSLVMGGILGALLVTQNWYLFGKDSVNMLGIPLLRERTADKKPIYVCPQKVSEN